MIIFKYPRSAGWEETVWPGEVSGQISERLRPGSILGGLGGMTDLLVLPTPPHPHSSTLFIVLMVKDSEEAGVLP